MKTAREYAADYRQIAKNLGLTGDSVEMLAQMLAHFTYTNEVDSVSMVNEASLERAVLDNSKIQHCVEACYSVYRGNCPRIALTFKPTRYYEWSPFQKILSGNSHSLWYLGYQDTSSGQWNYSQIGIAPRNSGTVTVLCLLASTEIVREYVVTDKNRYYVDLLELRYSGILGRLDCRDSGPGYPRVWSPSVR